MVKGGMCGERGTCIAKGGHAWQKGGMHGKRGACMVKGGHVWYACPPPFYEIRPVNARAVRILLECILVDPVSRI